MKIPSGKMWTQFNQGEVFGSLNRTHNAALDTMGQLKLANRPVAVLSSDQENDLGGVVAFPYFDGNFIAVSDDGLFTGEFLGSLWYELPDFTPNTTKDSDAIVFNDRLVVTINAQTTDWDGVNDDNYTLEALTSSVPHPMAIFDSNPTYKLAIGNGNSVKLLDTSYSASSTVLTLADQFTITTMAYRNGYLYIGTRTDDGTEGRVFLWNGTGTNAQYEVTIGSEWVYSLVPYGSSVACMTNAGQLLQISGTQAIELGTLPVYHSPHTRWQNDSGTPRVRHRGMAAVGQTIYINLSGELEEGVMPEMVSGLWVFDPEVGLYHRATASTDALRSDNGLTLADDTLTTEEDHMLKTGDTVQFRTVAGLTGVSIAYVYYVKVISDNEIKLSLSRDALAAEQYVTIGGTPTTSDILFYFPNTDNGSQVYDAGAISLTTYDGAVKESLQSEVLWAAETKDESGNNVSTVNVFHNSNTVGSFITQRIYTENIEQSWKALTVFLDGIVTENDSATLKVQTKHQSSKPILLEGVWSATNVINTNETMESTGWYDIKDGDEIVFYDGRGQGKTAHVTNVASGSLTYSITVDENFGVVNDVVTFYRTNFVKLGTYGIDKKKNEFVQATILQKQTSPWIKIKVELRGMDVAVNMLDLANDAQKSGL